MQFALIPFAFPCVLKRVLDSGLVYKSPLNLLLEPFPDILSLLGDKQTY